MNCGVTQLWIVFGMFIMAFITSILSSTLTTNLLDTPQVG